MKVVEGCVGGMVRVGEAELVGELGVGECILWSLVMLMLFTV